MITSNQEYEQFLANLSETTPPVLKMRLPTNEPIYKVDWNTRKVEAPEFIGVQGDHEAECIYFIMDRYYDAIDLSETIGIVSIRNANKEEYYFIIPYYDIYSMSNKIIFPWIIQAPTTLYEGAVQFSFKFFKVNPTSKKLIYELNTLTAKTKVLPSWDKQGQTYVYNTFNPESLLVNNELIDKLNLIIQAGEKLQIFWKDV